MHISPRLLPRLLPCAAFRVLRMAEEAQVSIATVPVSSRRYQLFVSRFAFLARLSRLDGRRKKEREGERRRRKKGYENELR